MAFSQPTTGTLLKLTFPSLRSLLYLSKTTRLLNADLVVRPVEKTFDSYYYKLPPRLNLYLTNGSNIIGGPITEGGAEVTGFPSIDYIYKRNTNYTFTITSYISQVIASGSNDFGLFMLGDLPGQTNSIDRVVIGDNANTTYQTKLVLTLLLINE